MNTWVRKSFKVGVLSAGVLLFAGTAANADWNTAGNAGILDGNQTNSQVQAPIDVCGNAISVVGSANASCVGGSWASLAGDSGNWNSFGNSGIGSGNQINSQVQAPIDVCGNAVGVFGQAGASCVGGSWATIGGGAGAPSSTMAVKAHHAKATKMKTTHILATSGTESAHTTEATTLNSFGNSGILTGNQANSLVQVPIDVCGNAIGVIGSATASCVGGSTAVVNPTTPTVPTGYGYGESSMVKGSMVKGAAKSYGYGPSTPSTGGVCSPTLNSFGNSGIGVGNQANLVTQAPVEISGNAIGVLGSASAFSVGGAWATC